MKRTVFLKDLRSMSVEDLKKKLSNLQVELVRANTSSSGSERGSRQPHPKFIHNLRKDIARIKTILTEKEKTTQ